MVPLLKFYFHEEVRQAAVQAVPELLKSVYMAVSEGKANGADMQYVKQMLDYVWQPLIDSMVKVSALTFSSTDPMNKAKSCQGLLYKLEVCLSFARAELQATAAWQHPTSSSVFKVFVTRAWQLTMGHRPVFQCCKQRECHAEWVLKSWSHVEECHGLAQPHVVQTSHPT